MSIELAMLPNHLIFCCPLLLLPSIFPSIRVFSNGSALHIRWPNYWRFSINPFNKYSGLISLGLTGLILLQSKGLSRVFSSTTTQKHQFFGTQPSLWSSSHIRICLLEKPKLWLDEPLLGKWCLCFATCCLGLPVFFPEQVFFNLMTAVNHLQWFWSPTK